jgi:serine/threonine protein kinase
VSDTATGTVLGTPQFMAPEQARGEVKQLDRRADVYSLGATLYAFLVGARRSRARTRWSS